MLLVGKLFLALEFRNVENCRFYLNCRSVSNSGHICSDLLDPIALPEKLFRKLTRKLKITHRMPVVSANSLNNCKLYHCFFFKNLVQVCFSHIEVLTQNFLMIRQQMLCTSKSGSHKL